MALAPTWLALDSSAFTAHPPACSADLERLVKSEAELESIRHHIEDMKKLLDS